MRLMSHQITNEINNKPEIMLAEWAAILNCDSRYFGRKV